MEYIWVTWSFWLLLSTVNARTIYKVLDSGQCDQYAGNPIISKSQCESQSLSVGWPDTTAVSSSFSSYLPQGCILKTSTGDLRMYIKETQTQCSPDYKCLCEITAPDCSEGLNRRACLCSASVCTRATGLVCLSGQCSAAAACYDGLNSDVCRCGLEDCTPSSGLVCSSAKCEHAEICPNRIGGDPNPSTCQCGDLDCYGDRMYCYSESSTCMSACPGGTYVDHLLQCQHCAVKGYYCPEGATVSPTSFQCPSGRYGDQTGLSSVDDCPPCSAGRYSTISGITSVEHCTGRCPAGKFSAKTGLSSIEECAGYCSAGRYSYETGLTSDDECKGRCSTGKYSSMTGLTSDCHQSCPRGKYGNAPGSISEMSGCLNCTQGHMCAGRGLVQPKICPIGSYQDQSGQETCHFCPKNTYSDSDGAIRCLDCPKNPQGVALKTTGLGANSINQCQLIKETCPSGQRPIENTCTNCPRGFFSNGKGSRCILCPIGYYQSEEAQLNCTLSSLSKSIGAIHPTETKELIDSIQETSKHTVFVNKDPFPVGIMIVYSSLFGAIVIVILFHRCCPDCFKEADLIFSGDHIIEDTHARRILKTRIGAAFTVAIPFVVAIVSVFVFTSDNTLTQNGLVPIAIENIPRENGLFQKLRLRMVVQSPLVANCNQIKIETGLNCTKKVVQTDLCNIDLECWCHPPFGGIHSVSATMPDSFQRLILSVEPDAWNNTITNITVPLIPTSPMTGTDQNPTWIDFDVIRSKSMSYIQNEKEYGLQMSHRTTQQQHAGDGTETGQHVIKIRFFSTETLFVLELIAKLTDITRIGTVLTLTISAISGLRLVKLTAEHSIDQTCQKCCKNPPSDVVQRVAILEERDKEMKTIKSSTKVVEGKMYEDQITGRKYNYNPLTRKSTWVKDITL